MCLTWQGNCFLSQRMRRSAQGFVSGAVSGQNVPWPGSRRGEMMNPNTGDAAESAEALKARLYEQIGKELDARDIDKGIWTTDPHPADFSGS